MDVDLDNSSQHLVSDTMMQLSTLPTLDSSKYVEARQLESAIEVDDGSPRPLKKKMKVKRPSKVDSDNPKLKKCEVSLERVKRPSAEQRSLVKIKLKNFDLYVCLETRTVAHGPSHRKTSSVRVGK